MKKSSLPLRHTLAMAGVTLGLAIVAPLPAQARVAQETLQVSFSNIRIALNGQTIPTEFEPFVFDGRTYLPVRDVANALGFAVTWEAATNTVHLTAGATTAPNFVLTTGSVRNENIVAHFNNIRIAVNGVPVVTEFDPFVFDGRTYLPVRDVAHAVGFEVTWEAATSTVHLTQPVAVATPNYPAHVPANVPAQSPPPPTSAPASANHSQNHRPSNPAISLQHAIEIAQEDLVRRGIPATFHSDSGMEWERGQWVWELEFRATHAPRGRHVIEFYINVDTGVIVKFEQGD